MSRRLGIGSVVGVTRTSTPLASAAAPPHSQSAVITPPHPSASPTNTSRRHPCSADPMVPTDYISAQHEGVSGRHLVATTVHWQEPADCRSQLGASRSGELQRRIGQTEHLRVESGGACQLGAVAQCWAFVSGCMWLALSPRLVV